MSDMQHVYTYLKPFLQPYFDSFFGKNATDSSIAFVAFYLAIHLVFLIYVFSVNFKSPILTVDDILRVDTNAENTDNNENNENNDSDYCEHSDNSEKNIECDDIFEGKTNDEIHDILALLGTRKSIFVNWYDRDMTSFLVKHPVTDEMWSELNNRREEIEECFDNIYNKWASCVFSDVLYKNKFNTDISSSAAFTTNDGIFASVTKNTKNKPASSTYINDENDEPEKLLVEMLLSFSNHTLSSFTGGEKGTKAELVKMIMEPIYQNAQNYKEEKLRKLSKQLE